MYLIQAVKRCAAPKKAIMKKSEIKSGSEKNGCDNRLTKSLIQ